MIGYMGIPHMTCANNQSGLCYNRGSSEGAGPKIVGRFVRDLKLKISGQNFCGHWGHSSND